MGGEKTRWEQPLAWTIQTLSECTVDGSISYGIVQPGRHDPNGVPMLRVNNVRNGELALDDVLYVSTEIEQNYTRTRLCGGEVILTLVGSTGQSLVIPKELAGWNVARAIAVIRPKDGISPNWINICLQSEAAQQFLDSRANTTVQKTLNLREVKETPILLPPSKERLKIESVIKTLSDKINLNRRINKTLEETAQAIFRSWFVDFDPVKAKARANELGCDPEQAAMAAIAGKLSLPKDLEELTEEDFTAAGSELARLSDDQQAQLAETAALFPAALVESELGLIPEGWEVKTLADIASFVNGRNFTKNATGSGRIVIRIAELNSGIGSSTQFNEVEAKAENVATPDTILFAWSGSLGVHRWHKEEALINQHIFKVISTDIPDWFIYFQLAEHMAFFRSVASHKAVTMGHIKRSHLNEALLAYPTNPDLIKVASISIQPLYDKIHILTKESGTLSTLRDTLLPKLLSGELSVDGIEPLPDTQNAA